MGTLISMPALRAALVAAALSLSPAAWPADAPPAAGIVTFKEGPRQLTVWKVPNIPSAAEPYYGTDNTTLIPQVQDPDALRAKQGASGGAGKQLPEHRYIKYGSPDQDMEVVLGYKRQVKGIGKIGMICSDDLCPRWQMIGTEYPAVLR